MLLQSLEIAIHYSAGMLLVGLTLLILTSINKAAAILIGAYALYSLTMELAFNGALGLGFLAEIFLSADIGSGKPAPTNGAIILGITGGISKLSLAGGIYLLAIALKTKSLERASN